MARNSDRVVEIRQELTRLRSLIISLEESERALKCELESILDGSDEEISSISAIPAIKSAKAKNLTSSDPLIDFHSRFKYGTDQKEKVAWDWTVTLRQTMSRLWNISDYRFNQEAVCNAVLANRNVLVIMPTGGGKSLTYQLPAVLSQGTTLVISPLLALMADQIMHLEEVGVEATMLTATTTRQMASSIMKRLVNPGFDQAADQAEKKKSKAKDFDVESIKLCYVTPEKIAKSKTFVSTLQKMYEAKRLARIVIDEAHCCSSLGHDFRPDYKQLSILKTLFPEVPIVALTATCPPNVMKDLLKILKLGPITGSRNANRDGTVLFTAPLNRPNLHYQVLPKPHSAAELIDELASWIEKNWPGSQGIVYTLSQKDTASVAQGLMTRSNRRITTGIYHASLSDSQKHQVHSAWRDGSIQVVCATTAFGMGIDAPQVRFVIHHTLPKSLEGYYQESGRAGRDGLVSDCVLFWKTTDLVKLSGMVASEMDGIPKLYSMAKYAVELRLCRCTMLAEYFNTSHSSGDYLEDPPFNYEKCGQCDNCRRDPTEVQSNDFTVEATKICYIVDYLIQHNARITLIQLADLSRGSGPSLTKLLHHSQRETTFDDPGSHNFEGELSLEELIGGKVVLTKEQAEEILLHLILQGYLEEQFVATAYTVNSYIKLGKKSRELLRNFHPIRNTTNSGNFVSNVRFVLHTLLRNKKNGSNKNKHTMEKQHEPVNKKPKPRATTKRPKPTQAETPSPNNCNFYSGNERNKKGKNINRPVAIKAIILKHSVLQTLNGNKKEHLRSFCPCATPGQAKSNNPPKIQWELMPFDTAYWGTGRGNLGHASPVGHSLKIKT
ncbi:hypothetical protein O181_021018 [Austropuccinia psidii MF-1]|uniref:ATP-dependent DNA helicase n=1 Tax=Austropuccinia psidii MF-1 TaxID=1389203 RepID=A0A9Q3CE29_9BASI|nr:hypothetical protein [Austropuccinia psidii MF-1]